MTAHARSATGAPIVRSVLSDQVRDFLLQEVFSGRYPPGTRIVETRVARELGVSQAPVREALRDLEAVGLVEITAYQGARVRQPDEHELLEAYGVRAELESFGVGLAIPRVGPGELASLEAILREMEEASTLGDLVAESRLDASFHLRLMELSANGTLQRVWGYLEPISRTAITFSSRRVELGRLVDLHRPIVDALRAGDPEAATTAVRRHFDYARTMFTTMVHPAAEEPG